MINIVLHRKKFIPKYYTSISCNDFQVKCGFEKTYGVLFDFLSRIRVSFITYKILIKPI